MGSVVLLLDAELVDQKHIYHHLGILIENISHVMNGLCGSELVERGQGQPEGGGGYPSANFKAEYSIPVVNCPHLETHDVRWIHAKFHKTPKWQGLIG
jgi:hypothetical protein